MCDSETAKIVVDFSDWCGKVGPLELAIYLSAESLHAQ